MGTLHFGTAHADTTSISFKSMVPLKNPKSGMDYSTVRSWGGGLSGASRPLWNSWNNFPPPPQKGVILFYCVLCFDWWFYWFGGVRFRLLAFGHSEMPQKYAPSGRLSVTSYFSNFTKPHLEDDDRSSSHPIRTDRAERDLSRRPARAQAVAQSSILSTTHWPP